MNEAISPRQRHVALAPADPTRKRSRERRRAIARAVRRALLGLAIAGAAGAVLLALRPRPVPVDVAPVVTGPLVVAIEETGRTRVKDRYVIAAPVSGNLLRVRLEVGDAVREGDAIAAIAPADSPPLDPRSRDQAEARLASAAAALDRTRAEEGRAQTARELSARELERAERLAATATISPAELDQVALGARMRADELASSTFARKAAAEEVRLARAALDRTGTRLDRPVDVRAPVSGVVLRVIQKSAGVLQAGAPLVEIGDPSALEIVVDLLSTDAVKVATGSPVVIQRWGGDLPLAGVVHHVEPYGFTRPSALGVDEQRVNVVVTLTDPQEKWARLGDGYQVEARVVLWQAERVVKVPLGAVFRRGDGWGAYRLDGDEAHFVDVAVGHRGEREAEIVSGVAPGAQVLVHPSDRVKDGVRVERR